MEQCAIPRKCIRISIVRVNLRCYYNDLRKKRVKGDNPGHRAEEIVRTEVIDLFSLDKRWPAKPPRLVATPALALRVRRRPDGEVVLFLNLMRAEATSKG